MQAPKSRAAYSESWCLGNYSCHALTCHLAMCCLYVWEKGSASIGNQSVLLAFCFLNVSMAIWHDVTF